MSAIKSEIWGIFSDIWGLIQYGSEREGAAVLLPRFAMEW